MQTTKRHLVRNLAGGLAALLVAAAPTASAQEARFSEVRSLGDSLTDIGNFHAATGNQLPPFPYFEGRVSNGPVWVEYLATLLDRPLDYEKQAGFAGAMTGSTNINSAPGFLLPGFAQQVAGLIEQDRNHRLDPRGIHTIWIGANDIFVWLQSGDPNPWPTINQGVANTIAGISDLADAGAQNFVVINLPDLGRTPTASGLPPAIIGFLSFVSASYNAALDDALDLLEADRSNLKIVRVSAFDLINDIVANPAEFGFTNVTDAALDSFPQVDPDDYLFWDGVHPTTAAHQIVAETVYAELTVAFPGRWNPISVEDLRTQTIINALSPSPRQKPGKAKGR